MDKEEILKIAKEKYPVGTVFISPFSQDEFTVQNDSHHLCIDRVRIRNGSATPFIYYGNMWAEIISSPTRTYELW